MIETERKRNNQWKGWSDTHTNSCMNIDRNIEVQANSRRKRGIERERP